MKLLHLSDLHFGKRFGEYDLQDEQNFMLKQLEQIIEQERPTVVVVAGDIYDSHEPTDGAIELFNDFVNMLSGAPSIQQVFITRGNHDPRTMLKLFSKVLQAKANITIVSEFSGLEPYTLQDEHGAVDFYLLPYIKPSILFTAPDYITETEQKDIKSTDDAIRFIMEHTSVDTERRNVLLCHQWVSGGTKGDTERMYIGGSEEVAKEAFTKFDYVALGHLHNSQTMQYGNTTFRYPGTLQPYSFTEAKTERTVTLIELGQKGTAPKIKELPIAQPHQYVELHDTYANLLSQAMVTKYACEPYLLRLVVTDNDLQDNVHQSLKLAYGEHLISFDQNSYVNKNNITIKSIEEIQQIKPFDAFQDLFRQVYGTDMNEEEASYMQTLIDSVLKENN